MASKAVKLAQEASDDMDVSATAQPIGLDFIPNSWDEVVAATGGQIETFESSPWQLVDKELLVSVPFMITGARFNPSQKYNGNFVSVQILTQQPLRVGDRHCRYVFNDSSTGILDQLSSYMAENDGKIAGVVVRNGLRKSTYQWYEKDFDDNPIGEPHLGTTYYLS